MMFENGLHLGVYNHLCFWENILQALLHVCWFVIGWTNLSLSGLVHKPFLLMFFSIVWNEKLFHIFSLFKQSSKIIQKLEQDSTEVVVVAPLWPTQSWWISLIHNYHRWLMFSSPDLWESSDFLTSLTNYRHWRRCNWVFSFVRIANKEDPNQTTSKETVWSGSTQAILVANKCSK